MALSNPERLKEIEKLANDFFISKNVSIQAVASNLGIYYSLANLLCNNLPKFENNEGYDFDPHTFTKKTPLENFEIIVDFYKVNGIDFDLNNAINDGTIELIYSEYQNIAKGKNYYNTQQKLVDSCNNGLVTDAITLIHELSHLRNQGDTGRSVSSDLLTESIATAEELIFLDYLSEIGYEYEANIFSKYLYNLYIKFAKDMQAVFKFGLLYKNLGSLSKESYLLYYKSIENYEEEFAIVDKYLKFGGNPKKSAEYIMAYALGPYMYYKYKSNPAFMSNIQSLHEMINKADMVTCFRAIDLYDLDDYDLEKIAEVLRNLSENLKKFR